LKRLDISIKLRNGPQAKKKAIMKEGGQAKRGKVVSPKKKTGETGERKRANERGLTG